MSLCENCADKTCYGYSHSISECEDFIQQTNADRIRAMTDEELAEYLSAVANDGGGSCAPGCYDCSTHTCKEAWLDWLKSPVAPNES